MKQLGITFDHHTVTEYLVNPFGVDLGWSRPCHSVSFPETWYLYAKIKTNTMRLHVKHCVPVAHQVQKMAKSYVTQSLESLLNGMQKTFLLQSGD